MFKKKLKEQWLISFRWDTDKGGGYGTMLQEFEPIFEDVINDIKKHSKASSGIDLNTKDSSISIMAVSKIKTRR